MTPTVKGILAAVLLGALLLAYLWVKVDAYGGDPACLVVHCVKVIR